VNASNNGGLVLLWRIPEAKLASAETPAKQKEREGGLMKTLNEAEKEKDESFRDIL